MLQREHSRGGRLDGAILIVLLGLAALSLPAGRAEAQVPPGCPAQLGTADLVDNVFSSSYCELCSFGTIRILVENPIQVSPGDVDLSQIVVRENLLSTGLTYIPGSTTFAGVNVVAPAAFDPAISGTTLTWTLPPGFSLDEQPGGPGSREQLIIEFRVQRSPATQEGLITANRDIQASVTVAPSCAAPAATYTQTEAPGVLPLRQPVPNVDKAGRNLDAGQGGYSSTVYGHAGDDVIWRIRIQNTGTAPLQDFRFDDSIAPGNMTFHHVCSTEAAAVSAGNGGSPGACVAVPNVTTLDNFDVRANFGGAANPYIVAAPGATRYYYIVGRVNNSCVNRNNTVGDVQWGCQSQPPVGGITAISGSPQPTLGDTDPMSTQSIASGLNVAVSLDGVNTSQPMGARGTATITITNNSGGTVYGGATGIDLHNLLPIEYVADTTAPPVLTMAPAYGAAYPGMIDTLAWTNPQPGTVPLTTTNPALPLGNRDLHFVLTSSTIHPEFPTQRHMIRHGDTVTIRIRTVLIAPQYYDLTANLDVRVESPTSTPPNTDPTASFPITDRAEIWFREFCTPTLHNTVVTENDTARPEDLDVDMVGAELLFILTNTGDPLPLTVRLTNNGGHDATDYRTLVSFGQAMTVSSVPSGCSVTANPPALPEWRIPATIPATASVYSCSRGTISPGEVELFNFEVVKNTAASFDDDLTFRADVTGEIELANGTPLWFPPPVARADGITDRANDYTLDGVRARVVGYNLFKDQLGVCTENNPPPGSPDDQIQIGEQCSFHIESGGWFGFQTPGFTYIAVQNIQVVEQNPNGQGFIAATDPLATSTPAIMGVTLNPPPPQLADAFFDWRFNTVVPAQRITEKDHWFRVDVTTRMLNDPQDTIAAPNQHAAISTDILTSTFEAVFHNPVTNLEEIYNLGPTTIGFPREVHRRVDLRVTEPRLTLVKEVCNETLYGAGPACSNFVPLASDGDAFDTYIYRITVTNEASSGGVPRAPAYDITLTSVTDPSDMLFVDPLTGDALDNDADTLIDGADAGGEGTITENVTENGTPAQVINSYTHSNGLLRLDAGQNVVLYYRVDPDDDVAPLQTLTSSVTAAYDSLAGASGSQTAPLGLNGELGGARRYVSAPAAATIRIIPVQVTPKQIIAASNTPLVPSGQPQPVSIGEEIRFRLEAMIPVAQLRNFVVRDTLPAGMRCAEAPAVNLNAPPYSAAGFVPGGVFTPTCTATEVVWNFGNQTVTISPPGSSRFDFQVEFVARIDNAIANQDGLSILNGGAATVTTVSYIDEGGNPVVLVIDAATVLVREPLIALTKSFSVAQVDAGDLPRVTVTATNNGTATAYNLRVLDDLTGVDLAYAGNIAGANPPVVDLATFGPARPLFRFSPDVPIPPGGSVSFSFAVEVGDLVEPHQILANTIQADWTSLPGIDTALNSTGAIGPNGSATGMRNGALPNAANPLNDYEAEAMASVDVPPVAVAKLDLAPAMVPTIGAHKPFRISIALPEGATQNVLATDDLATGTVSYVLADTAAFPVSYEFIGILSINGQPPSPAALTARPTDGTSGVAIWSIGDVVTAHEDDLGTPAVAPEIRIHYFGRIHNDLVTDAGDTLRNTVVTNYLNGETGAVAGVTALTAAVVAVEPNLAATKSLTNVTPGKAAGDPPAFNDLLQYVVTIVNNGTATAHDSNVVDTIPPTLTLSAGFTPTASISGVPVAGFVATPAGAPDGPLVWGAGNGDGSLDIPPGGFLDLTYRVVVRTPLPDPDLIENRVFVDWTSLDAPSVYERTGAGCPITTAPNDYCFGPAVASGTAVPVGGPDPTLKENTQATASVGETFRYRITIPATPYAFPIYDVRIYDDLTTSAASLRYVGVTKVSAPGSWTPTNTGTPTNLVIEDTTAGIDIPAGQQIVVDVSVVLEDTPTNVTGLPFSNTASYIYNWIDGDGASQRPGVADTTPPMTIVGPDTLTMDKRGPVQMTIGTPATFTLDVQNVGTGPAWNLTFSDQLPDGPTGGTCDTAPTAITARIFQADGVTPVSPVLVAGTDYTTTFQGPPTCSLGVALLTPAAVVGATERAIVTYSIGLDSDTQDAVALTNVAGATQWYSATGADRRTYTRVLTNGTVGTLDHEDALTTTSALPQLRFEKTVRDMTTGADPALTAQPGDTLRYRLVAENQSAVAIANFSLYDELDRLNPSAYFVPGTLQLVTVPVGADTSNTNATAGVNGSGVVDVRNLSLPAGATIVLEFEATLASVIAAGSVAADQAELRIAGLVFALSDDPNVNGPASPIVTGDEDPTRVTIASAPLFQVLKTSTDLTGNPAVLLAGETLRYTITVKNVGSDNATDAMLRDAIPVNTTYVPGSTRLNGAPVTDLAGPIAPLSAGIPIHAPENPTPGAMRADPSPAADNVATLVFDVVVANNVPDGTVVSNQAFVSAVLGGVVDQPSDDPSTGTPNDPTRNVVGNLPLLFAAKSAALQVDAGTIGVVDPGDVLRYTVTLTNSGAIAATNVALRDAIPANTSYVADSVTLNGLPVGQPDGGVSPLVAGIPVSSSDLTPPVPAAGAGTVNPGQAAIVTFDLMVNGGVPSGTLITNQARVTSVQIPNLLTDGDGNPNTGPEPTVVVVGAGQQLLITKTVAVVGGGAAAAGGQLEYIVRAQNVATVPATNVVITDNLALPVPGQLAYVAGSATLNGSTTGVLVAGSLITADYSTANGPLAPGQAVVLRFLATIDPGLAIGTRITNTGTVTWNLPPQTASASASVDVGGMPGVGQLSGSLWHDSNFNGLQDPGETPLSGWTVELLRNGQTTYSILADASGAYQISGLGPNDLNGDQYALRFSAPGASSTTASLGVAVSPFTNVLQQILDIIVSSGSNLVGLDLPIQPNGVVYDSVQRVPISGARVTLLDSTGGAALPSSCFDDPAQQGQVTLGAGQYKFDLNFSSASCPSGGSYLIAIDGGGAGYGSAASAIIPPLTDASTSPFSVPPCPGGFNDAVPSTALYCEVQTSASAPPSSVAARSAGTNYYTNLVFDASQQPGSAQIYNNHLALDPSANAAVAISKTTPMVNVVLGQLVPYEIVVRNQVGSDLLDLSIVDNFPAGFSYVPGSAQIDGIAVAPQINGRQLVWSGLDIPASGMRRLLLLLAVGAGVSEGEYVNYAEVVSTTGSVQLSGIASATVRVVPDPDFACTDVFGKVFTDVDRDGIQDKGDLGIQGVRIVTPKGLIATTDQHGRYHITCAIVPDPDRGSNMVLKLDDRSLPTGYRLSTRQVQVKRATRGKALRFNFGASIHKVVGLDLADAVFEPGTTVVRPQWQSRITMLLEELRKAPATLRLSYVADVEDARLVDRRLAAVQQQITEAWKSQKGEPLTIEPEIYWRRGAPPGGPMTRLLDPGLWLPSSAPTLGAPRVTETPPGENTERILDVEQPENQWTQDPELLALDRGDRLEEREVLSEKTKTVKLKDVVPPIRFESGVSDIPASSIDKLRDVLDGMQHLDNVRLHLIGHSDDQPLSPELAETFGDNEGLSRERAGEVAEFVQAKLQLPPEAISFSWAGAAEPLVGNTTPAGRAQNRRVEVEVWYDTVEEQLALEDVLISEDIKRVKVCRMETVCKMVFREGHERRARVKNLIAPLQIGDDNVRVPDDFVQQVSQALGNMRNKQNVTVKFVGFTDDAALTGRTERIYGSQTALSKAMARRVSLAVQDALDLPSSSVASDGRGAAQPVASNQTPHGRASNRRVEVEFWYDDPLQELPEEPQICPDAAGEAMVTRVYDPPWGGIPVLPVDNGHAVMPEGYGDTLLRAMADVQGRPNVRLRFVGYTGNERLDRRTAQAYGDDIGLSVSRARRTKELVARQLGLADSQVEHEGHGYLHSSDVVNGGFVQDENSYVAVQVVYDEPAVIDDYEGVEITRITRELRAKDPLALNLMRITVDGEPIDDPGRSSADIQRCTDVALERADIEFRFDDLDTKPRLSVSSDTSALAVPRPTGATGATDDGAAASTVDFKMYSNYAHFIERAEVRVFARGESLRAEPLAVVEIGPDGVARWQPEPQHLAGPADVLEFVLRAYDAKGRFDETAPQTLWLIPGTPGGAPAIAGATPGAAPPANLDPLLAGYGESELAVRNIELGATGSVRVEGGGVPPDHRVFLAGNPVPVDENGRFVADAVLPEGTHTVEVAVLDEAGNGELFLRDLELAKSDWFYVAVADLTVQGNFVDNQTGFDALQGANSNTDPDSVADGRLAFYVDGKFGNDWKLTASADTGEGPVGELFSNFLDKSPDALFRRLDQDYFYPTYGDDGTVEETAATMGKFYARLSQSDDYALWGNFRVGYRENELTLIERGLYGGKLHYQTDATTSFGARKFVIDGFAADPGTVPTRDEFLGTGGSLYYLKHRDVLMGSDRLRIEIRDKQTGLVVGTVNLDPDLDYDLDYIQGRVLLAQPISAIVNDNLLVRTGGLSGNEAWLVVNYEFVPGFEQIDALAAGGEASFWLTDYLNFGASAYRNAEDSDESGLYGGTMTLRKTNDSWLKAQTGWSSGLLSSTFQSNDGGYQFADTTLPVMNNDGALGYRIDGSVGFSDWVARIPGRMTLYYQNLDAGYSAPGQIAATDTQQFGGTLDVPVTDEIAVVAKADRLMEDVGVSTDAQELDVAYQMTENWRLSAGVRNDDRSDNSPIIPVTQELGARTDTVVQVGFDPFARWRSYVFGQATLRTTGNREENNRGGVGGSYRINDRFNANGEVSYGDGGPGVRLGTDYQESEETSRYMNYALDTERGIDGAHARRGSLIGGMRTRLSDSASVYQEDRYQHGEVANGLTRALGMDWSPTERLTLHANWETGTLTDQRTQAQTDRNAGGGRIGYRFDPLFISTGVEYLADESEQFDGSWSSRTTWLFRNSLRLQLSEDWRFLGKYNVSFSDSSRGDFFDGGYTEAVFGFGYRPIANDRLNVLAKFTYFYNMPATDQVNGVGTPIEFLQKSHIASIDATYDLTDDWTLGGKYAYRRGEVSLDRVNPDYFDNDAHLFVARVDWRFVKNWETSLEGRSLYLPNVGDVRSGALFTIYRYLGKNFKVGVGYNFTDYSDDLTDLSYDRQGVFFNIIGTL